MPFERLPTTASGKVAMTCSTAFFLPARLQANGLARAPYRLVSPLRHLKAKPW